MTILQRILDLASSDLSDRPGQSTTINHNPPANAAQRIFGENAGAAVHGIHDLRFAIFQSAIDNGERRIESHGKIG